MSSVPLLSPGAFVTLSLHAAWFRPQAPWCMAAHVLPSAQHTLGRHSLWLQEMWDGGALHNLSFTVKLILGKSAWAGAGREDHNIVALTQSLSSEVP